MNTTPIVTTTTDYDVDAVPTGLFTFYNAFDDVTVYFDDESPDGSGPFNVGVHHADRAISTENIVTKYFDYKQARAAYFVLVHAEVDCVEGER